MDIARRAGKFLRSKTFTLLCILILIMILFWYFSPGHSFLRVKNITSILDSMVLFILFAIAVALLIISGEVDLSPGYIGTTSGVTMATLMAAGGIPWYIVMIVCLLLGGVFGLINAVLVNKFRIQSFIATLAVGSFIAKGLTYIIPNGQTIVIDHPVMSWLGTYRLFDLIPVTVIISIVLILIYGIVLAKTQFGRSIYLSGGNREAARLAGLNPKRLSYILFMNSGMLGAFAGMLHASHLKQGNLDGTNSYSFPAVTAVIFGGISFGGGSGNMLGCFLGLLIINSFNNGLIIMRWSPYWRGVASGILLLLALSIDYFSNSRAKKAGIRKGGQVSEQSS